MTKYKLKREGDNRKWVVGALLPVLELDDDIKQVLRWAYGYDHSGDSYEQRSDGSSGVSDVLLLGRHLKDPPGVAHDWLFHLHHCGLPDPRGHEWKLKEADDWYGRAVDQFGHRIRSKIRRFGLMLFSWYHWRK